MTLLDSLKRYATVVATGDIEAINQHRPQDASNPALLYQAVRKPEYQYLLEDHAGRGAFSNLNRR
jgi:hypothetical protein